MIHSPYGYYKEYYIAALVYTTIILGEFNSQPTTLLDTQILLKSEICIDLKQKLLLYSIIKINSLYSNMIEIGFFLPSFGMR